ncbi:hypothetical protein C8J57DRAFT_1495519 [Mycena rebaudengoi]|nr:hypothetical protein C8J57DRAFT_1495519 [Mycena rebaudengoi]
MRRDAAVVCPPTRGQGESMSTTRGPVSSRTGAACPVDWRTHFLRSPDPPRVVQCPDSVWLYAASTRADADMETACCACSAAGYRAEVHRVYGQPEADDVGNMSS